MKFKLFLFTLLLPFNLEAQLPADTAKLDSRDSLMQELQQQLQEMKMREILLQDQLETSLGNARQDSIRIAQRKSRIDSLRGVTPGEPLVIGTDTLFKLYASRGAVIPQKRIEEAEKQIRKIGQRITFSMDSVLVYESDYASDIMCGDAVILSLTDVDALWQNKSRQELAKEYQTIIANSIQKIHEDYGLKAKLKGIFFGLIIILIQIFLIRFTNKLYRWTRYKLLHWVRNKLNPIKLKGYEFLDTYKQGRLIGGLTNVLRYVLIIFQLFISIPLLFTSFPETEHLTRKIFGYIWNPFRDILLGVVAYLPNIIKIVIIYICVRYVVKAIKFLADEVDNGKLHINGFYAEWAKPTYQILRALLYCFMVVLIWPLLPYSDSEEFKGVSVFVGLVVSLGSTSIVSNLVSGLAITYMRPFHIGDFIEVQSTKGIVIEKTVFVTRLRTSKNQVVTVPNSAILTSQVVNYSSHARRDGVIVHTEITIGYSEPRDRIERLLLTAADKSHFLSKHPEPFVLVTALEDFYIRYQINAYTSQSHRLLMVYSELHKNILDTFNAAGVEIMSPHFIAKRDGDDIQIPSSDDSTHTT